MSDEIQELNRLFETGELRSVRNFLLSGVIDPELNRTDLYRCLVRNFHSEAQFCKLSGENRDYLLECIDYIAGVELHKIINGEKKESTISLRKMEYSKLPASSIVVNCYVRVSRWSGSKQKSDVGPRLTASLRAVGWVANHIDPKSEIKDIHSDKYDIAIIDMQSSDVTNETLEKIRMCHRFVIGLFCDAWHETARKRLNESREMLDLVWLTAIDEDISDYEFPVDRITIFPPPLGYPFVGLSKPKGSNQLGFVGSIERNSITRIIWRILLNENSAVSFSISDFNVETPYSEYVNKLLEYSSGLSFCARESGVRSTTSRGFEIIACSRLLVQEYCPAFRYFYLPDSHFLEFSSITELENLAKKIQTQPTKYHTIARDANNFSLENYSERRLAEHLSFFL